MDWLSITLPAAEVPRGQYSSIEKFFEHAFTTAGVPSDAAMIENSPDPGQHVYYFSPAAVAFAREFLVRFGAIKSAPPQRAGSSLIIGWQGVLDKLLSNASKAGK